MKKVLLLLLVLTLVFSAFSVGCGKSDDKQTRAMYNHSFTDKDWCFKGAGSGEYEAMHFGSDGSFFYSCECGEPVGDSDLYEAYSYNEEDNEIILNGDGVKSKKIKLLGYDDYCLSLRLDGEYRCFTSGQYSKTEDSTFFGENPDILEGYSAELLFVGINEENAEFNPLNYNTENTSSEGMYSRGLSEDLTAQEITVYTDAYTNGIQKHEYEIKPANLKAAAMDQTILSTFVWYNEENEICKLLFYKNTSNVAAELPDDKSVTFKDEKGNVIITNADIEAVCITEADAVYGVLIKLNSAGVLKFSTATKMNIGKTISVYVNGELLTSPTVNAEITGKEVVLNYSADRNETVKLFNKITGESQE